MFSDRLRDFRQTALRVGTGILCVLLGLSLRYLDARSAEITSAACAEKYFDVFCWIVKFSIEDLRISALSNWFLAAGFVIIVLSNFVADLLSKAFAFAADRVASTKKVLIHLLENKKLTRKDMNEIVESIFQNYTGNPDQCAKDFAKFLVDVFMTVRIKEGGCWRRNYRTDIKVEKLGQNGALESKNYLGWKETVTFHVVSSKKRGKYLLTSRSVIDIREEDIMEIIKIGQYRVKKDNVDIFSFSDYHSDITEEMLKKKSGYKKGPLNVYVKKNQIFINYSQWVNITAPEVQITIDEYSVIRSDDTNFVQGLLEATEGFTLRFSIDSDYVISLCTAAPEHYQRGSHGDIKVEHSDNEASITTKNWVLPGIGAVIIWARKVEPSA